MSGTTTDTDENSNPHDIRKDHPFWRHVVEAGGTAADMTVDVAAISAIAWMAVSGVDPALLQSVGAMVVSVALGKRYMQSKDRTPHGS